jgi:hypothetical protein
MDTNQTELQKLFSWHMNIQRNMTLNNKWKEIDDILVYSNLNHQQTGFVMQVPFIGVEDRAMHSFNVGYNFAKEGRDKPALLVHTRSHQQFIIAVAYAPYNTYSVAHLVIDRNERGEILWDDKKVKYYMPKIETVAVPILYMRMFLDGFNEQKQEVDKQKQPE